MVLLLHRGSISTTGVKDVGRSLRTNGNASSAAYHVVRVSRGILLRRWCYSITGLADTWNSAKLLRLVDTEIALVLPKSFILRP